MLSDYIIQKLSTAQYKLLADGTYFGQIPSVQGVWANAKKLEDCRDELKEVLEDWLVLALRAGENIPGLKIRTDRRKMLEYA